MLLPISGKIHSQSFRAAATRRRSQTQSSTAPFVGSDADYIVPSLPVPGDLPYYIVRVYSEKAIG